MKRPTNLNRYTLWQSRAVQDAALWVCAVLTAIALSIPW